MLTRHGAVGPPSRRRGPTAGRGAASQSQRAPLIWTQELCLRVRRLLAPAPAAKDLSGVSRGVHMDSRRSVEMLQAPQPYPLAQRPSIGGLL